MNPRKKKKQEQIPRELYEGMPKVFLNNSL